MTRRPAGQRKAQIQVPPRTIAPGEVPAPLPPALQPWQERAMELARRGPLVMRPHQRKSSGPPPAPNFDLIPYTAKVVRVGRYRYELRIGQGPLKWGWSSDGFAYVQAWGSRAHALRKCERILARLNRKRLRKLAYESEAMEL